MVVVVGVIMMMKMMIVGGVVNTVYHPLIVINVWLLLCQS